MKKELFEIFMPFFGDRGLFEEAVMSVLAQTNPEWRLTIVDDCYPSDFAGEYLKSIGDPRIRYIRNEKNLGISANFQKCAQLADAEFFSVMGCDDLLLPDYVDRMHSLISHHPQAAFIQPGVTVIDQEGGSYFPLADRIKAVIRRQFPGQALLDGEAVATSLSMGCWTYFPAIAWNTAKVREFPFRQDFGIVLDLALQFELLISGGLVLVDDVPIFAYRRHRDSVSMSAASGGSRFLEEAKLYNEFTSRFASHGWVVAARAARIHLTSRLNLVLAISRELAGGNVRNVKKLVQILLRPTS